MLHEICIKFFAFFNPMINTGTQRQVNMKKHYDYSINYRHVVLFQIDLFLASWIEIEFDLKKNLVSDQSITICFFIENFHMNINSD